MRELNNIYKHIFLYVYAPYEKRNMGRKYNRSILDKQKKNIKHLTFSPRSKQNKTHYKKKRKKNKISQRRI